jgi:hypothetical protein
MTLDVVLAPQREGKLEAVVAVDIEGMRAPLGVSVIGEVKGMVFVCSVKDPLVAASDGGAVEAKVKDGVALSEPDAYRCVCVCAHVHE